MSKRRRECSSFEIRVIPSDLREAEGPKREILDAVERCRFSDDARFAIKLALEEAICNAVKHGNKCDASKTVTVYPKRPRW